jgi:hypothetical protein
MFNYWLRRFTLQMICEIMFAIYTNIQINMIVALPKHASLYAPLV